MKIGGYEVKGINCDANSRCQHYHSAVDVVAIKFYCCGEWFSCYSCHQALCHHSPEVWPKRHWNQPAILCGVCGHALSVQEYLSDGTGCPRCEAAFNPGCKQHRHLYFEIA